MSLLPQIMRQASDEMTLSLQRIRTALSHNLSKGESAEETVRRFFRRYLPSSIGIAKGQVIDSLGHRTKQLDVIAYDMNRTPILFSSEEDGHQLVPSEGVLAVVEVKTNITASDVPGIVDNMTSVKELDKSAYTPQAGAIVHATYVHGIERDHLPTLYFVFTFESGELAQIRDAFTQLMAPLLVYRRVDMVCALSKGVILNVGENGNVDGVPSRDTTFAPYETANGLLMFYLLVSRFLLQAQTRAIALQRYLPADFRF